MSNINLISSIINKFNNYKNLCFLDFCFLDLCFLDFCFLNFLDFCFCCFLRRVFTLIDFFIDFTKIILEPPNKGMSPRSS